MQFNFVSFSKESISEVLMAQSEVENFATEVLEIIDLDKASSLSKEIDSQTPSFRESDK